MEFQIVEEHVSCLSEYGQLPIGFRVDRILEVVLLDRGLGGFTFKERTISPSYIKDYDAIAGNDPEAWSTRWNLSNWAVLSFKVRGQRVGGAVPAFDTDGMEMLEGRKDLALLWDLRVHPDYRRSGVGHLLFRAAESWAHARGCRYIKAETQNINVAACHFYARQGCSLGAINRYAYQDFPEETQLTWYKDVSVGVNPPLAGDDMAESKNTLPRKAQNSK